MCSNRLAGEMCSNRLAGEKSPYLLQHAHNPVDWFPWGDEAFELARREGKPIFLSIGYSTCHWCHVMERESFEDETTAGLMNEYFVNIKIDREERPDLDRVYMAYVQAVSGSGGWPMSVWLTPELEPFFGGTYFPPGDSQGRAGFPALLRDLGEAWRRDRGPLEKAGKSAIEQLRAALTVKTLAADLDADAARRGFEVFRERFDPRWGGFGSAPKFPRPATFDFLLRYFAASGVREAAEMVEKTLSELAQGGMNDQLGGGFHRYSVDRTWHVPHFEKMLYDQAQLSNSYLEAYQLTGDEAYSAESRRILDYVLRELTDRETGAFYSAEDADSLPSAAHPATQRLALGRGEHSRKIEGAFYVWTQAELKARLGDDLELFSRRYGVLAEGNADDPHGQLTGTNVLHIRQNVAEIAQELGLKTDEVTRRLSRCHELLLAARGERERPQLDDKIICAWNGMMIGALARAHQVLDEPRYLRAARRAADFAQETLWNAKTHRLLRRYRDGEAAFDAYLEDYAQLAEGLIDLYEAGFELRWLALAETLTERMIERFDDPAGGGFFSSSGRDDSVLLRLKEDYDGAEPSGNSVAAGNLLRLGTLCGREDLLERAEATIAAFSSKLARHPEVQPRLLANLELSRNPPVEIVFVGDPSDDRFSALVRAAHRGFAPSKVLRLADAAFKERYGERLPHILPMQPASDGAPRVYVCRDRRCEAPTTEPRDLSLGPVQE